MHDAAFDAAGIDAPLRAARARPGRGRGRGRGGPRPRLAGPRGHRAVQAGRGRPVSTRSSPRPRRSARSTTSPGRPTAGWSASTPTRRGSAPASSAALGRPLDGAARRRRGRRRRRARGRVRAPDGGARRVTSPTATAPRPSAWRARFAGARVRHVAASSSTNRRSPRPCVTPTSRSTRRPSACSIRARRSTSRCCRDGATVFDLVYVPPETPLLARGARARAAGGQRLGDAHRPGRDRVPALDGRRRHGRRHAHRDRPLLADAAATA